jgi:hypothetical protein
MKTLTQTPAQHRKPVRLHLLQTETFALHPAAALDPSNPRKKRDVLAHPEGQSR